MPQKLFTDKGYYYRNRQQDYNLPEQNCIFYYTQGKNKKASLKDLPVILIIPKFYQLASTKMIRSFQYIKLYICTRQAGLYIKCVQKNFLTGILDDNL